MRVFLTGGTGFVGSHVAEVLKKGGHEVVALVRGSSDVAFLEKLGVKRVEGALGDLKALGEEIGVCDAVVHVVGLLSAHQQEKMFEVNVEGTRELAEVAARVCGKGTPFVYISSVAAQGPSEGARPREPGQEEAPVSLYGKSKLGGEAAALTAKEDLKVVILRPPPVYGPRDRDMYQVFQLANLGLAPVLGKGERHLSVIHAEDVAGAVLCCLEGGEKLRSGAIYPIDDGEVYTWRELGAEIAAGMGKKALTVPVPAFLFSAAARLSEAGGKIRGKAPTFDRDKYREMIQPSWVCGNEAICRELGFEPKWKLREGSAATARWYRAEGWL